MPAESSDIAADMNRGAQASTRHPAPIATAQTVHPSEESLPQREHKLEAAHGNISSPQPTYTLNEILAEYKTGSQQKLRLASHLAYPPERPYVQDLEQLVGDLAARMIKAVPDEIQKISPEDVVIRLVDRPSVNAYVMSSNSGRFEIFINRGLIEEFLTAPEFQKENLCIDALAGVVAHEICHTNFKRRFQGHANSMLQEEYCDILPAKMLERIGLRPEVMSTLCDLFVRVSGEPGARKIDRSEPHASSPIRKEIYEKGAWHEYEKARRKAAIPGVARDIDVQRSNLRERLESISKNAAQERIISPILHDLLQRGFASATCDEKLGLLNQFMTAHRTFLSDCHVSTISTELCSLSTEALKEAQCPRSTYGQHPLFIQLSEMLYRQSNPDHARWLYQGVSRALELSQFGAFEKADEAYCSLIDARSKESVRDALEQCQTLLKYSVQPTLSNESWRGTLLPQAQERLRETFNDADFDRLRNGQTIPFPFLAHHQLQRELTDGALRRGDPVQERLLNSSRTFYYNSGIARATDQLLGERTERGSVDILLDFSSPRQSLCDGLETRSLEAFAISIDGGITLQYPSRNQVGNDGTFEAGAERETNFATFLATRGSSLIEEAQQLTSSTIFPFIEKNACLIMPQVHPVGMLSPELTASSQALARTVFDRLNHLLETNPSEGFRQAAIDLLTKLEPARHSHHLSVYTAYHQSVFSSVNGCRVDPNHPFLKTILENPTGLLTNAQQLASISILNGLEGKRYHRITGPDLRTAFAAAVGGEERLRKLFGIRADLPPDQFIEGLVRVPRMICSLVWELSDEAIALREIRGQYIDDYLLSHSNLALSFAQLHALYDLCAGTQSQPVARRIQGLALAIARDLDLAQLSNEELMDTYQRLTVLGVIDRSVALETRFNAEIADRLTSLKDIAVRNEALRMLVYPRPFTVNEVNRKVSFLSQYDTGRFSRILEVSSMYVPRTVDPNFERLVVREVVRLSADRIRLATGKRFDDGSEAFLSEAQNLLREFDQGWLPPALRSQVLRGLADELLTQRKVSFLFRDNLLANSKYQSRCTFASAMQASHRTEATAMLTNAASVEAHNALIELKDRSEKDLRNSLFSFLLARNSSAHLENVSGLLLKKLEGHNSDEKAHPLIFRELGITGISGFSSPEGRENQKEIIEYHLRSLHQRFQELDVRARGAALSLLAVDSNASEESFAKFRDEFLIPRILPKNGPYNELLLAGIKDYFEFYSNAVHHKYMVACAILASAQEQGSKNSPLATVGLVARSFLGAHGTAGYKLLQRIRNHPSTPQEIKDVLHNVLDETISLSRWTIHERIAEYGPTGATEHWVGRAKAGSMCLSVPVTKRDGSESFLSIIHPGAHVDSLYWLQNFATMAANLSKINPSLGIIAPMALQTRRLIENETDFDGSPRIQQTVAEDAYTYSMVLPQDKIRVSSSCAPLISAEGKKHSTDFMKSSGNKEAGRVCGQSLLEMVAELREKSASGEWSRAESAQRLTVLKAVAFSVAANEVRLIASGRGKDHDRHPGNYLIDIQGGGPGSETIVDIRHFDFGCTDTQPPSANSLKEAGVTLQRAVDSLSVWTLLFNRTSITDSIAGALFEKGTYVPEVASIPLGLLAATGANERISIGGRNRQLLEPADLMRALKVGLESASIPKQLSITPKGITGWVMSRGFQRIDTRGVTFK
jgi:hypothetical protein